MGFRVELTPEAVRDLKRIDRPVAERIQRFLADRVATADDPRSLGGPLSGVPYWRYRVGNHRVLVDIRDDVLIVLVVETGHRSTVYRRPR
jgi:mRNA interferase RelE/StbE